MAGSPKKRARREQAAAKADPLDEAAPRPPLAPIPFDGGQPSAEALDAVATALTQGYPRHQIAKALGTTVKTLKRLINKDPILSDATEARRDAEEAELRDILMGMAKAGDTVAAIFLGKSQYGWRDRGEQDKPQAAGGGVLVVPAVTNVEEWEKLAFEQQRYAREGSQKLASDADALGVRTESDRRTKTRPTDLTDLHLVGSAH